MLHLHLKNYLKTTNWEPTPSYPTFLMTQISVWTNFSIHSVKWIKQFYLQIYPKLSTVIVTTALLTTKQQRYQKWRQHFWRKTIHYIICTVFAFSTTDKKLLDFKINGGTKIPTKTDKFLITVNTMVVLILLHKIISGSQAHSGIQLSHAVMHLSCYR